MADIALLGLGRVGSAVAARLAGPAHTSTPPARIATAFVRDTCPERAASLPPGAYLTSDADAIFARRPQVLVELLGGLDPAAALVSQALDLGVPVVTANKSLLAAHGPELAAQAARQGVPLLYEAAVLAGVPFLSAVGRGPQGGTVSRIEGVLNGTSNFILDRVADGATFTDSLTKAQRRGLAEPRPDNDVRGVDAAEKLAVLAYHLGWGRLLPQAIDTSGIEAIEPADLDAARHLGGGIRSVAIARREADGTVSAFSGPAFLPAEHRLAAVRGLDNLLALTTPHGVVTYSGPGAGPEATADTVIDDIAAALRGAAAPPARPGQAVTPRTPRTGWFLRLAGPALPAWDDVGDLLAAHGIWMRRTARIGHTLALLTHDADGEHVGAAVAALQAGTGLRTLAVRALEV